MAGGRGWAGEEGREGKWRGGKGRAPKLLLNQGPSEPCYATDGCCIILVTNKQTNADESINLLAGGNNFVYSAACM